MAWSYKHKFAKPSERRANIDMRFPKTISEDQSPKTLSIGGRLTLLKSVLGSIPVFHMSIFKVSSKVLHILESIRSHFFNGHDPDSKKASWVKWNNVLTDKKRGGL
ncbi:hypothetical protein Tco_1465420, partial [Tanacetum coccineum]